MNAATAIRYSPEAKEQIKQHVLIEVATGRSVRRIIREDDGLCSERVFWQWHLEDEEFQQQLGRARQLGQEALLDDVHDIIDDATNDVYIEYNKDGDPVAKLDGDSIARARLRAEYRVKMAQMLNPKKYGAKVDVTSGGEKLPAGQVNQTKIDALIAVGVSRALKAREQQALPAPEENEDE